MRVVLDTNILISACWKPGGNESQVVALTNISVCISEQIEAEYREVVQRKKFAKYRDCLEALLESILKTAIRVSPLQTCSACSDADDNQLLDCALAAEAQYVITGNLKHFPTEWHGIQVINARRLLELQLGSC